MSIIVIFNTAYLNTATPLLVDKTKIRYTLYFMYIFVKRVCCIFMCLVDRIRAYCKYKFRIVGIWQKCIIIRRPINCYHLYLNNITILKWPYLYKASLFLWNIICKNSYRSYFFYCKISLDIIIYTLHHKKYTKITKTLIIAISYNKN